MRAMPGYYNEEEAARLLGIKVTTLQKRRCTKKEHPPFIKEGRDTFYPVEEFKKWLHERPLRHQKEVA